jgi:hypothetical protein
MRIGALRAIDELVLVDRSPRCARPAVCLQPAVAELEPLRAHAEAEQTVAPLPVGRDVAIAGVTDARRCGELARRFLALAGEVRREEQLIVEVEPVRRVVAAVVEHEPLREPGAIAAEDRRHLIVFPLHVRLGDVELVPGCVGDQRVAVRVVDRIADPQARRRRGDAGGEVAQRRDPRAQAERRDLVVVQRVARHPDREPVRLERVLAGRVDDQERRDRQQLLRRQRARRDELRRILDVAAHLVAVRDDLVDVVVGEVRQRVELGAIGGVEIDAGG